MKLKEIRILDADGARFACMANDYCTRADCDEYAAILNDAAESSRKPGGHHRGRSGPHCCGHQGPQ